MALLGYARVSTLDQDPVLYPSAGTVAAATSAPDGQTKQQAAIARRGG